MKLLATSIVVLFFVSTFFVDQSESFGLITGTITISAASLALVGGVVLLKAVAIKALALGAAAGSGGGFGGFGGRRGGRHGGRGRREVGEVDKAELEEEATFTLLAQTEPDQCYKRLICDLATGQMPQSDNDIIPILFREDADQASAKFSYFLAAQLGKTTKDIKSCEIKYLCSVPLEQVFE